MSAAFHLSDSRYSLSPLSRGGVTEIALLCVGWFTGWIRGRSSASIGLEVQISASAELLPETAALATNLGSALVAVARAGVPALLASSTVVVQLDSRLASGLDQRVVKGKARPASGTPLK